MAKFVSSTVEPKRHAGFGRQAFMSISTNGVGVAQPAAETAAAVRPSSRQSRRRVALELRSCHVGLAGSPYPRYGTGQLGATRVGGLLLTLLPQLLLLSACATSADGSASHGSDIVSPGSDSHMAVLERCSAIRRGDGENTGEYGGFAAMVGYMRLCTGFCLLLRSSMTDRSLAH